MKFYLGSDLHLAHSSMVLENKDNVDILILAGDIFEFDRLISDQRVWVYAKQFFIDISKKFKHVYWVPGNHEYYGFLEFDSAMEQAQEYLKFIGIENILILDNQSVLEHEIPIHFATLWTDMNNGNPLTMSRAEDGMNDYREIRIGLEPKKRLSVEDTVFLHKESMRFLNGVVSDGKDCVVITHHQPSFHGFAPQHKNDALRYAFGTDLSEFILDHPNIKMWGAGHTHTNSDYLIGDTRIVTNCRGYHGESISYDFQLKLIEI